MSKERESWNIKKTRRQGHFHKDLPARSNQYYLLSNRPPVWVNSLIAELLFSFFFCFHPELYEWEGNGIFPMNFLGNFNHNMMLCNIMVAALSHVAHLATLFNGNTDQTSLQLLSCLQTG